MARAEGRSRAIGGQEEIEAEVRSGAFEAIEVRGAVWGA